VKNSLFFLFPFLFLAAFPCHAQKTTLLWATYFGGDTLTAGNSTVIDDSGNIYIAGYTYSTIDIATKGAYQTIGDSLYGNAFWAKFSASGNLLWATYFGYSDDAVGLYADKLGNVYVTGVATSFSEIASSKAYQVSCGGEDDVFLAKFSSSGNPLWCTYYGGRGEDYGYGITSDTSGNIYITGTTYSLNGIATSGAYQTLGDSVNGDAFLAKFSPSGQLIWGTYYGENGNTDGYGVTTDNSNNIYITGFTDDSSGIATKGAYQTSYLGGGDEPFLAKFNFSGSLLWGTYFGEIGYGESLASDIYGNIYLTGSDGGAFNNIATSGAYQTSISGGFDAFLAKFNPSGNLLWSTYFGGSNDDEGVSMVMDISGNIYVSGITSSISGIATSGAYQTSYGGGYSDVFLAKFNDIGNLLGATYYGGAGDDESGGIAIDKKGDVYLWGATTSTSGIATSGAYQTLNNSSYYDAFLAKFHIVTLSNDAGISSIISPRGSFCSDSISIKVVLKNYGPDTLREVKILCSVNDTIGLNYRWNGSLKNDSTTVVSIGNYYFKPGIDAFKVWTEPIGFTDTAPGNDTATIVDTVKESPDAYFTYISSKDSVKFLPFIPFYSDYSWSFGDGDSSDSINPIHHYSKSGMYTISLTVTGKNGCSSTYTTTDTINYSGLSPVAGQISRLNIFPNPFSNQTTIEGTLNENTPTSLSIYDMTGRVVVEKSEEQGAGGHFEYTFDASRYGSGIYIVKLTLGNEVVTREIVKIQ